MTNGTRIGRFDSDRNLPSFSWCELKPSSRGFIYNSYFEGLDPNDFFFHSITGREGLIDTSVKTSETGYVQRRLVKALDGITVRYDLSCRSSDGMIVEYLFGSD